LNTPDDPSESELKPLSPKVGVEGERQRLVVLCDIMHCMASRHVIVHLIRGEAKLAHEAITRDMVERLDAFPIHDRIVPHLTLKRWFELDKVGMNELYNTIDRFVATHTQSDYRLHGLNNFGEGVIYVDVDPSREMSETVRDLMTELRKITVLTFDEIDDIEDDFHATLAMRALKPFDFRQTWDYLQTQKPLDFKMKFDNIAVLRKDADKWIPERIWELPA
jgi:2'-5' RNA ligase